uniref:RING-type E3 ubiquitin transferase n=1 Tax=Amphora coffeiformis TaxID=265554 RepID=A0A7S3L9B2_9STRA|mmetsp:Transcript_17442/g.35082  ORF Transcript_17442/g.35082 Transcript_17442/m.35082 type:complete len:307 (+) Transcript_17442:46-966(+)|eukprot:scaffold10016_cov170-Amphora_coffeaeformis.AAC.5
MFRKPKRKLNKGLRRKDDDEADKIETPAAGAEAEEEEESTTELLEEARKRLKQGKEDPNSKKEKEKPLLHAFGATADGKAKTMNNDALATSTAMHHPDQQQAAGATAEAGRGADGVFREGRNKFWAGPIKAATNVRVTARFDYQPDICKDYKETGFCGFGDTCIYLHDRGDQLSGWQLEEKWQEEQRLKKEKQEKQLNDFLEKASSGKAADSVTTVSDDGLPFACHLCRNAFDDPVITACQHYFCEKCIMSHVRNHSDACPICGKETHRVFNEPTKLIAKKRQVLGAREAKQEGSWKAFFETLSSQ